jgi:signal transduction histidine kinase
LLDEQVSADLDAQARNDELAELNAQIGGMERQMACGNLSPEDVSRLTELENSIREYETRIDAINNPPGGETDYAKAISEAEAEISRLKRLVNEALRYAAVRAELMFSKLRMNRAQIVLCEVVKSTGEVKDCFQFSYDGRDYKCLSLSEKIKAGLEVSELVKRLSSRNYPVFIDNGESLCAIDNVKPSGQVLFARVVRGQELCVTQHASELRKAG